MVVVTEAECVQAEWMGRAAMRLASQALAMEVEQVEQVVAPTIETRGVVIRGGVGRLIRTQGE